MTWRNTRGEEGRGVVGGESVVEGGMYRDVEEEVGGCEGRDMTVRVNVTWHYRQEGRYTKNTALGKKTDKQETNWYVTTRRHSVPPQH